jgi:hypothetical protein
MPEKPAKPLRRHRTRQESDENVVTDRPSSGSGSTAEETLGPPNAFVSYTHENSDHSEHAVHRTLTLDQLPKKGN